MMTSALLRDGPDHIAATIAELQAWPDDRDHDSVSQLRGRMSHATTANPAAFERANYVKVLHSWTAPHNVTRSSPSG